MKVNLQKFLIFYLLASGFAFAKSDSHEGEEFNASDYILHHVLDSHEWHIADFKGTVISIPLPVILWDNGLKVFMSSEFHHGETIVKKGNSHYAIHHDKIYKTNSSGTLSFDEEQHPINESPLDFSITKNVASMIIAAAVLLFLFISLARSYKKEIVPRGKNGFLEPLVVFVSEEIAKPNIGEKKYKKFLPYLLTVFFFIWINNLFGLLPIPPGGGANVSGNIAFTLVLSIFTFVIVNINGNKDYWKHVFWMPGVPVPIKPILTIIEVLGLFTKPFALMIRLFANITAGHILILSLIGLIFIVKSELVAIPSTIMVLFMFCIELLVAALQAYVFTLLSAVFIGQAVAEHEHH